MIYTYKDTYSQHEVDCLVEKARNEAIYEAFSLQAFRELSTESHIADDVKENCHKEKTELRKENDELGRFPIDWEEKAIPAKITGEHDTGAFYYYTRDNHVVGYIVMWGHGPDLETRREVKEWIQRMVISEDGLLHGLGIEAVNYKKNPYEDCYYNIFVYFTDDREAWDFYRFQQNNIKEVNWHDYE